MTELISYEARGVQNYKCVRILALFTRQANRIFSAPKCIFKYVLPLWRHTDG